MADVVEAEVMKNHGVPILILQLPGNVPGNIIIDLRKVLPAYKP